MALFRSLIPLFVFAVISELNLVCGEELIVDTKSGRVEGKVVNSILQDEKYYSFLGIPYAEPPVGDLRFMAPKPHPGWDEVLDCKRERNYCAQYFLSQRSPKYGFYGNEDCLTLNIHTPQLVSEENPNLPVIVFIANEQFRFAYNITKDYAPDFFMKENVIIVAINYRVGSLGFLSFEDDLLPGNNGLRDVILALQWLKDNIANFGGNPKKVTLMGNQAGAVLVDTLLYVPKAKGLFHGIILQSGTSWSSMYFGGRSRSRAEELVEALEYGAGTSTNLLRNLNGFDAAKLTEAELRCVHADEARQFQKGVPPFIPIVEHNHDDALITEYPENTKLDIDVPIMIGYNSREGLEFTERYLSRPQFLTFAERDFLILFPIRTDYHFKVHENVYRKAVQEIKDFYFDEGYVKTSKPGEYITYIGDAIQFYALDYTVRKYVNESKAPVYYYTFDYDGEYNLRKKHTLENAKNTDGTWGANLADELCYLFVCRPLRQTYAKAFKDADSEDMKVVRTMVRLWSDFAKTGNPTPEGSEFKWKEATKEHKDCLLINEDLEMKANLHEQRIKFWDDFIEKYRLMAVNGVVEDVKDEL